jgi:hypothetical protein
MSEQDSTEEKEEEEDGTWEPVRRTSTSSVHDQCANGHGERACRLMWAGACGWSAECRDAMAAHLHRMPGILSTRSLHLLHTRRALHITSRHTAIPGDVNIRSRNSWTAARVITPHARHSARVQRPRAAAGWQGCSRAAWSGWPCHSRAALRSSREDSSASI